jgi:predicted tellurium resistance membrane protein TerC
MMSIFILIGAYRYFAGLAERYRKTKWHYGVLAIVVYLGTQLLFGFCYGIYQAINDPNSLEHLSYTGFSGMNFIAWLISIAAVYGVYKLLEIKFSKEDLKKTFPEIEEIGNKEL